MRQSHSGHWSPCTLLRLKLTANGCDWPLTICFDWESFADAGWDRITQRGGGSGSLTGAAPWLRVPVSVRLVPRFRDFQGKERDGAKRREEKGEGGREGWTDGGVGPQRRVVHHATVQPALLQHLLPCRSPFPSSSSPCLFHPFIYSLVSRPVTRCETLT